MWTLPRFKSALAVRVKILLIVLLLLSGLGYLGASHYLLELASHFRVQYFVCAALGSAVLLWASEYRFLPVAVLSLVTNGAEVLPWYFGKPPQQDGVPLKLLLSNVHTANQHSEPLLNLIAQENPDLIVLQELDERWLRELSELSKIYPFFKAHAQDDNFGIGVWSRSQASFQLRESGRNGIPSIVVRLPWAKREAVLIATHPVPPISAAMAHLRNQQLHTVAEWAAAETAPVIVLGDLNLTPWSPFHQRLVSASGLRNARKGFGVLPTWPMQPLLLPLRIPLDRCLVSSEISVRALRTGSGIGSDHLPLLVELSLRDN